MLKRFINEFIFKNKTKQEKQIQAVYIKQKLSLLYAIIAWHCLGFGFVILLKHKLPDDPMERRQAYTKLTGVNNNLHVYQARGLRFTNEFDVIPSMNSPKVSQEEKEADEKEIIDVKVDEY